MVCDYTKRQQDLKARKGKVIVSSGPRIITAKDARTENFKKFGFNLQSNGNY